MSALLTLDSEPARRQRRRIHGVDPVGVTQELPGVVLIVSPHPVVRRGIAAMLNESLGPWQICEAGSIDEALSLTFTAPPNLVLLDTDTSTPAQAEQMCMILKLAMPAIKIVVACAGDSPATARLCLSAGATGCVRRDSAAIDFADASWQVLQGRVFIESRLAQVLAQDNYYQQQNPIRTLTPRERDVLGLLSEGCSNRAIASHLVISEKTVKGHVSNILAKLMVDSRLAAAAMFSQTCL